MLRQDSDKMYIVYQSWINLSYKWNDMSRLLSDPLRSGYLDKSDDYEYWRSCNYSLDIQPFNLIDGPVGGGIIIAHVPIGERWLPDCILGKEADIGSMVGLSEYITPKLRTRIYYLHPRDECGWELGIGKRAKVCYVPLTLRHIDSAQGIVYWVIECTASNIMPRSFKNIPTWAKSFGLSVNALDKPPDSVVKETVTWPWRDDWAQYWFGMNEEDKELGYHLAVMMYISLHLAWIENKRLKWMRLLAEIEDKPKPRMRMVCDSSEKKAMLE